MNSGLARALIVRLCLVSRSGRGVLQVRQRPAAAAPEPVSRAKGFWPVLLAPAGTYGAWLIPLLPRGPELPALDAASAAILIFSEVLIVYTLLSLGRSFSLIPQARKLVTSGPTPSSAWKE